MSNINFISHESFPEDQYTKELVYLCIEDKYRVAYVRRPAKNGGMFWSVVSLGVTKDGAKAYFKSFMPDSNFLEEDILNFLEKKSWNKPVEYHQNEIPF